MAIFNIKRLLGFNKNDNNSLSYYHSKLYKSDEDFLKQLKSIRPNYLFTKEVEKYLLNQADSSIFTIGNNELMYLGKEQILEVNKIFPNFDGIFILGNYNYSSIAALFDNGIKLKLNVAALFEKDNTGCYNFKRVIDIDEKIF